MTVQLLLWQKEANEKYIALTTGNQSSGGKLLLNAITMW